MERVLNGGLWASIFTSQRPQISSVETEEGRYDDVGPGDEGIFATCS